MSLVSDVPVWAAGAVPLRGSSRAREVQLVHRPAYDDWTLPKGKARRRELMPATAVREVAEETSTRIRLAAPLTPIRYPLPQALKIVSWWIGVPQSCADRAPDDEVDQTAWLGVDQALATMTYADERGVLTEAVALPDTTPLVVLRHAKARRRESWKKPDQIRPLSAHGQDQLPFVSDLLSPFGIAHLVSSTSTRCVQTLEGYAAQIRTTITTSSLLSEEGADGPRTGEYVTRLARAVGASGTPTVVCGHRPVIPTMLAALGVPNRPLATAACVIAHLDTAGRVVRTEWYDTLRVKR